MLLREVASADRAELGDELFRNPSPLAAARLAELCLADNDELTRVAAAALHFRVSVDPKPSIDTLAKGTNSEDELVREVAATALARVAPRHRALGRLRQAGRTSEGGALTRTTLLIHGTWARAYEWWQPGGSFHTFLGSWRPDLYGEADRFEWTGGYSPNARADAASQLVDWIKAHDDDGLSLVTHSHGGNVAFLATWGGPKIGDLILLSCPVRSEYVPDFGQVGRLVSVRVKWDLVILADEGRQRFDDPRITEIVLPIWFNHSATHHPDVWTANDIAAKIDAV
jgi:pimeloyl-ACP methyl ester carboxylesterase